MRASRVIASPVICTTEFGQRARAFLLGAAIIGASSPDFLPTGLTLSSADMAMNGGYALPR